MTTFKKSIQPFKICENPVEFVESIDCALGLSNLFFEDTTPHLANTIYDYLSSSFGKSLNSLSNMDDEFTKIIVIVDVDMQSGSFEIGSQISSDNRSTAPDGGTVIYMSSPILIPKCDPLLKFTPSKSEVECLKESPERKAVDIDINSIPSTMVGGVQGQNICKTTSKYFKGLCFIDSSCRKVCIEKDKFEDGHCSKLQRKCLCTKLCAFDNIPNDVGTILVQDVKTLEAELLEEEIFRA
ncbi:hypothetical protein CQW23_16292 [Capsicum baccatum]|uniref:Knottins-like domain-containing protein n=1 Tax=Capsicum baccatum TaxID=33114 RepID=A0A2G2WAL4_CAPBA|nr:hypothetical protein CQW23_16292 [Capsicum baccatum]